MIGETPTTGARGPRSASRTPGTPRIVPIETTGLLGGSRTTSAVRIASRTPGAGRADSITSARVRRAGTAGCRPGPSHPDREDPPRRPRGVQPDPPLLEVDRAQPLRVLDLDVRLDPLVGHRQQPDAERGQPPALAQPRRDLRQRQALAEQPGADDVRGEVAVAEGEPVRTLAVGGELPGYREPPVRPAPPLALVDAAAQGVHDGVEVGADPQAVQRDVVGGVADD